MAAKFLTPLIVAIDGEDARRPVRLAERLRFETSWSYMVDVPEGYRSDLASIPRIARPFLDRLEGRTAGPAVVHDWLYSTHHVPRWLADAIFAEALAANGVGRTKRRIMWAAVRFGGWRGWKKDFWLAQPACQRALVLAQHGNSRVGAAMRRIRDRIEQGAKRRNHRTDDASPQRAGRRVGQQESQP